MSAVVYHYVLGFHAGQGYPHNTFLFLPKDAFNDFWNFRIANLDNNPYLGLGSAHFPVCNLIARTLAFLPRHVAKLSYLAVVLGAAFVLYARKGQSSDWAGDLLKTGVLAVCTYPMLFTLDRGNYEGFVFAFLVAFVISYRRNAFVWSVAFLAMATAMKGFPVMLLVLFVADRRYREAGLSLLLAMLLTLGSLLTFHGGFYANLDFLLHGKGFESHEFSCFLGNNNLVQRGVSLFTVLKIFMVKADLIQHVNMHAFLKAYKVATMILFFPLALYVVAVEKTLWKRVALLVFAMLLLPHFSADYKLLHILLPFALFLGSSRSERLDPAYLVLFCLLLIPKDYRTIWCMVSDGGGADISVAVLLNPLFMFMIGLLIVISGLRASRGMNLRLVLREHISACIAQFSSRLRAAANLSDGAQDWPLNR